MTCTCCSLSPFRWREAPRLSMFALDPAFCKNAKAGITMSVAQTQAVERYARRTGTSAGTIRGLSEKGDAQIEENEHRRRRTASHYRRTA